MRILLPPCLTAVLALVPAFLSAQVREMNSEFLEDRVAPTFSAAETEDLSAILKADQKPFTLTMSLSPSAGYDSNVIGLGEGLPLPEGVSRQGGAYSQVAGNIALDWKSLPVNDVSAHEITVGYKYTQTFHEEFSGYDLGDHTWNVLYIHAMDDYWSGRLGFEDKYTTVDGHSFNNKVTLRPAVRFVAGKYLEDLGSVTTEVAYAFSLTDYAISPSSPFRVKDADISRVELSETIVPKIWKDAGTKIVLTYMHFWNEAEGSDYVYQRNRWQFSIETRLSKDAKSRWHDVTASCHYIHNVDRYDHPNSNAGAAGFAFARRAYRDDVNPAISFDVLKYPETKTPKLSCNAQYHYIRDNSNIPIFNTVQHQVEFGVTYTFAELRWK